MDDIIKKYFSDVPTEGDYAQKNIFYPPTDPEKISRTQAALSIKFPSDYISFLLTTNGFEGKLGQSYSILIQIERIEEYTKGYCGEFFPWAVYIGGDGGNEMYIIDKRKEKLQFGLLPFISEENDFIPLGETFEEFIRHLYYNDFWQITDSKQRGNNGI
jgi:hypothetical protein